MTKNQNSQSKLNLATSFIATLLFVNFLSAQPQSIDRKKDPYSWMFGFGWNVVNDNEEKLPNLFDVKNSWNYVLFPSRFSFDHYSRKGWSFEGMIAYNQYKSSKIINDSTNRSGMFISFDYHVKYSFNRFMKSAKWLDPYLSSGLGLTYRGALNSALTPTANLAAGLNFWFGRRWGIQIQAIGKLALASDIYFTRMDYFQFTTGVVYRKQPSKKPNHFDKKKFKWTNERQRYNRRST